MIPNCSISVHCSLGPRPTNIDLWQGRTPDSRRWRTRHPVGLGFVDDIALIADMAHEAELLLYTVESASKSTGEFSIRAKPSLCAFNVETPRRAQQSTGLTNSGEFLRVDTPNTLYLHRIIDPDTNSGEITWLHMYKNPQCVLARSHHHGSRPSWHNVVFV